MVAKFNGLQQCSMNLCPRLFLQEWNLQECSMECCPRYYNFTKNDLYLKRVHWDPRGVVSASSTDIPDFDGIQFSTFSAIADDGVVDIKRVQSFSCEAYCSSCTKNEKKTCKMYIVGNHFYCDVCDSQFDTNTKDDKAKYTWGVRVVAEDTGGISEELVFYQEALQSLLGQSARDYYFSDAKAQGRAGKHLLGQYIAQVRAKSQAQKVIFTCTKLHKVAKVG
eukprot:TRINITY_DN11477_c0_g1_i3.p1 TRINITY_DN11477_c0_g1~~TRINITY_DN11477_c0_g1_i3.p1  ORF type:complete len:222 (+),score=24.17 TRINITY_DN11477_c0_g1_i3:41-706(+)